MCFLDVLYEEFFLKWYISRSKYVFGGSDVVGIFVRYRMERKDYIYIYIVKKVSRNVLSFVI